MKITFSCSNCGAVYSVDQSSAGKRGKCKKCGSIITVPNVMKPELTNKNILNKKLSDLKMERYKEYKVITVEEGGCGTLLLGSSKIPQIKLENILNQYAAEGWQVVFQVVEQRRFLLFWTRESVILTLGR
jgi:predicted Zn finger-like uncharacterized protein